MKNIEIGTRPVGRPKKPAESKSEFESRLAAFKAEISGELCKCGRAFTVRQYHESGRGRNRLTLVRCWMIVSIGANSFRPDGTSEK
jgi:hypothetical protein